MLDELISKFNTDEFQQKLRHVWDATPEYWEKVKLRQELCLEIQGTIIAKYGYKPTAAGVSRSSSQIMNLMKQDPELSMKGCLNNWLVSHLEWTTLRHELDGGHVDDSALRQTRTAYKVCVSNPENAAVVRGLEACRGAMVDAHQVLYEPFYQGLRSNEWLEVLGQDTIRKSLEAGILMMHAEHMESGKVAGYISCEEGADEEQFLGSWMSEPSQVHQIAKDADGQLCVDGTFALGAAGAGALAPHGKWLEAKLASSADGRRVGVVRFCIVGPGRMAVRFRGAGEQEWRRDAMAHRSGAAGAEQGPHTKINHVTVLPDHAGRGVGRLLLEGLLMHLGKGSPAVSDLRLSVVERNSRAISWYLKLGFSIVRWSVAHLSTLKLGHVPVVFLEMQRRWGTAVARRGDCVFGREVCGEKVVLLPECAPMLYVSMVQLRVLPMLGATIRFYDQASGLHRLDDGRTVDVTQAFARGLLYFERPLHSILARVGS